jgi:hypothetical protein
MPAPDHGLNIFHLPVSAQARPESRIRELREFARASEGAGHEGALVFTDNSQLDPWLVSQIVMESTERLCPLVAIQPAYMHPYSVAKMITSFAHLYGRRLYLNMVAGGFKNDLLALNDTTPHDERYARLLEYTTIIQRLLGTADPVSFEGRYYKVSNLKLTPPLPAELMPGVLVSGSSEAGMETARLLKATAVEYPKPPAEYATASSANIASRGIRIGIIARSGTRSVVGRSARTRKTAKASSPTACMKVSGFLLAPAALRTREDRVVRRTRTGWCRSRTTERCVLSGGQLRSGGGRSGAMSTSATALHSRRPRAWKRCITPASCSSAPRALARGMTMLLQQGVTAQRAGASRRDRARVQAHAPHVRGARGGERRLATAADSRCRRASRLRC